MIMLSASSKSLNSQTAATFVMTDAQGLLLSSCNIICTCHSCFEALLATIHLIIIQSHTCSFLTEAAMLSWAFISVVRASAAASTASANFCKSVWSDANVESTLEEGSSASFLSASTVRDVS